MVLGVGAARYEEVLRAATARAGATHDHELQAVDLQQVPCPPPRMKTLSGQVPPLIPLAPCAPCQVVSDFKKIADVPTCPWTQLRAAVEAVFSSWFSARCVAYREMHSISSGLGTAVTVQVSYAAARGDHRTFSPFIMHARLTARAPSCTGHGLRQHERLQRQRRGLHAQPVHRRGTRIDE